MAKKTYKYNNKTQLTKHFNVQEWKCKCGKNHDIVIDDSLPQLLENLMEKIGAVHGYIYSGYRCPSHNKAVGSSASGENYSHSGYAVDIFFKNKNGNRIPSKTVCLALEDMGHKYGIGYRCGGSSNASGQIHIDVKPRKWFGDESKSMTRPCCASFYDYFRVKKVRTYTGTFPKLKKGLFAWKKGDKDINVGYIQTFLNWCLECNLTVDNSFGSKTETQVKKFQKKYKLNQDGRFGPACLKKAKTIEK